MTRPDGRDLHFYGGLLLLIAGCGWVYLPAGLIAGGTVLLFMAIWRM
jgi:hypothetical protein